MGATPDVKIEYPCKAGWIELKRYVNTGNSKTTMKLSVTVTTSLEIRALDFTKTVNEISREEAAKLNMNVSVGATYEIVETTVSEGMEISSSLREFFSMTREATRETDMKETKTTKEDFEIGPGDQLYFYQRVMKGPGISCTLDVTSVSSDPSLADQWDDVTLEMITHPVKFIQSITVQYGTQEADSPPLFIREINGLSPDINKGHKGKYVWMVPNLTDNINDGATNFDIIIQKEAVRGWPDMAAGAGGNYRYVRAGYRDTHSGRVVEAKLVRSGSAMTVQQISQNLGKGWTACARDINEGRKGDYLYLAYRRI